MFTSAGYSVAAVINGASLLIKKEFNLDDKWLGFIVSSPLATAAICAFGAGILSDTIGRKVGAREMVLPLCD